MRFLWGITHQILIYIFWLYADGIYFKGPGRSGGANTTKDTMTNMSEDEEKSDCEDTDDGKVATVGTGVGIPAMNSMHKIIRENSKQRYP